LEFPLEELELWCERDGRFISGADATSLGAVLNGDAL
jgi:hypothetical protein